MGWMSSLGSFAGGALGGAIGGPAGASIGSSLGGWAGGQLSGATSAKSAAIGPPGRGYSAAPSASPINWGGLGGSVGAGAQSALAAYQARQTTKIGIGTARTDASTAFDRSMYASNTAYQRAMADMRKAGLNPILAYKQGGASSPSATAAASPRGENPAMASIQVQAQQAQINNLNANSAKTMAETKLIASQGAAKLKLTLEQHLKTQSDWWLTLEKMNIAKAQTDILKANYEKMKRFADMFSGDQGEVLAYLEQLGVNAQTITQLMRIVFK